MCGGPHQMAVIVQSAADFTTFRCQLAVNREREIYREREDERGIVLGGGGVQRERVCERQQYCIYYNFFQPLGRNSN